MNTPYTYLLTKPHDQTGPNSAASTIDIMVDRSANIIVQIRIYNESKPVDCVPVNTRFSCPFPYNVDTKRQLQLTYVFDLLSLSSTPSSFQCHRQRHAEQSGDISTSRFDCERMCPWLPGMEQSDVDVDLVRHGAVLRVRRIRCW